MAEVRTEIDLFDSWYRIADVNKDGKVGGGEAVPFLQRSGLSKDALFKVSGPPCCCHVADHSAANPANYPLLSTCELGM